MKLPRLAMVSPYKIPMSFGVNVIQHNKLCK